MISTCLLETCRRLKKSYYIKELCVKLVTHQKLHRDARSAKYKILLWVPFAFQDERPVRIKFIIRRSKVVSAVIFWDTVRTENSSIQQNVADVSVKLTRTPTYPTQTFHFCTPLSSTYF